MNGHLLIADAYDRGMRPADVYKPIDPYFRVLRRFVDADYFGVMGTDADGDLVPMHVNTDRNPFPWRDRRGRACRRTFRKRDLFLHLTAERHDEKPTFHFAVNSPKATQHLIGIDIDAADDAEAHRIACDVYDDVFCADEDYGGRVYIERSRNRVGRYVWMIVDRTSSSAEFNLLLNALSRAMRVRYRVDDGNGVDAVKATLHFDSRDALARMYAEADGNPNDDHRGVLMTMPLAGTIARKEFEASWLAFSYFVKRTRRGFVHAIPESHFRMLLARFSPAEADRLDGEVAVLRAKATQTETPVPPAAPSLTGNDLRTSAPLRPQKRGTRDRIRAKANVETSGKNRMRLASSLWFYAHGCYAPDAATLVAFYEAEGFARGDDTPAKAIVRLRRAEEALAAHRANPAADAGYDPEFWIALVNRHVTDDVRNHPKVRYRSPRSGKAMLVESELLAAGLYVLTCSAFACNRADRLHSCSQVGQEAFYKTMADVGVLTCSFDVKNKRVAVPVILQLAGLVVVRDAAYTFGGAEKGVGKKYGLGVNHPRYHEFAREYGDVVDPASLTPLGDAKAAA